MKKETLKRLIWIIITLLVVVAWLFFSYAPTSLWVLPQVTTEHGVAGRSFQVLALFCLVSFVLVQCLLVGSTKRILRKQDGPQDELRTTDGTGKLKLYPVLEVVSTMIPLLVTVGLAFASYQIWLNLPSP